MHSASGRRVGRYIVLELLGTGGMGEVYRARDAALNRDVALKILPEAFASDPERRVRFDREAQFLASLNHPHIAQIYGIEEFDGTRALAMELVEGSTLADLMRIGPIAMPDALAMGVQIADALDAAHERGIVHRDLKPANIKVTPDGQVKVLDFGLAKALEPSASSNQTIDVMMSPTVTNPATQLGVILGTAAYMSPEQAKGRPVDRRSDIWAFGVILFEMLTGRRVFDGETVTDILAAIVTRDPVWDALPPHTPEAVVRLLRRCLDRDRRRRLADAGEIRFQLEEAASGGAALPALAHGSVVPTRSRVVSLLPWAIALSLGTVAAVVGWQLWRQPHPAIERLSIDTPPGTTLSLGLRPAIALSPDGRRLAFAAASRGATRLYVRHRDRFDAVVLAGAEGASEPVFSPDGEWIAFFAGTKLNKVPAAGGPVVPLATENEPRGLSWDVADTLTYSSSTGGVFRVSAAGGAPARITQVAPEKSERSHRWPQMLAGGAVVLFTVGSVGSPDDYSGANIDAAVLATGDRRRLVTAASTARYVPTGHLVFARNRVLYAVRFDPRTLTVSGSPVPIVQGVADDPFTGATHYATSAAGVLAYVAGHTQGDSRRLIWVSPDGRRTPIDVPPGVYLDPRLSPDGTRLALRVIAANTSDIWLHDIARRTFTRLTLGGTNVSPVWSPDGKAVYYIAMAPNGRTGAAVWRKPADGSGRPERIADVPYRAYLGGVSAHGRSAVISYYVKPGQADLGILPLERGGTLVPLAATGANEAAGVLSPNARYAAYQSDESGRIEVYVVDVNAPDVRWQISTAGGEEPRFSGDGRVLYYRAGTRFMAVPVDTRESFRPGGTPSPLFEGVYNFRSEAGLTFDIDPRSHRFLMLTQIEDERSPTSVRLVINWFDELRRTGGGS